MGKPGSRHGLSPTAEHIGSVEGTRGSETSQYPQEKKSIEIPVVAASEPGTAQTVALRCNGVVGPATWEARF